jgi:hypothetical protein
MVIDDRAATPAQAEDCVIQRLQTLGLSPEIFQLAWWIVQLGLDESRLQITEWKPMEGRRIPMHTLRMHGSSGYRPDMPESPPTFQTMRPKRRVRTRVRAGLRDFAHLALGRDGLDTLIWADCGQPPKR